MVDPLDILELVDVEKPLRALDFCYQMDPDTLSMLDAISLCITVVAYAPDSQRGHQMLVNVPFFSCSNFNQLFYIKY